MSCIFDTICIWRRSVWAHIMFKSVPDLPPPPFDLIADRALAHRRHPRYLHPSFPRNKLPDSPLAAFYRLYEFLVVDDTIAYRNEIEYIWNRHKWSIRRLPDPHDPDPLRYALLAGLTEMLCLAFNRLISRGLPRDAPNIIGDHEWAELAARPKILEVMPDWAKAVKPLEETVYIPDADGDTVEEGEGSLLWEKYKIIIAEPHFYFV